MADSSHRNTSASRRSRPRAADRATHRQPGSAGTNAPQLAIGIVLAENFTLSSFAIFTDLLRLAADDGDLSRQRRIRWEVMGRSAAPVRASCGVMVNRTSPFVDPRQFDYIVIMGGILHAGPQLDDAAAAYVRRAARLGVPLVGMCTGSFILSRMGLMRDRCACVSWYHYQDFVDQFPDQRVVADRIFLIDRDRITLPGGAGAADFALYLIDRHLGPALAQKAQQVLQFHTVHKGTDAPPHPPVTLNVKHPLVRKALLLMEQNLARPLSVDALAGELRLSSRHLERLFRSTLGLGPAGAYREVRMRYAAWLLTHSLRSVTDIALSAGFGDCAHFSRQFREVYGVPPSRVRGRSQAMPQGELAASRVFA